LGQLVLMQFVYVFTTQAALQLLLSYRGQDLPSRTGDPRLAADLDVVMGNDLSIDGRETNNMRALTGLGLTVLLLVSAGVPLTICIAACTASPSDPGTAYVLFPVADALRPEASWWAAAHLAFTGLVIVAVGVSSTLSLPVSIVVFQSLVILRVVAELVVMPYKSSLETGAHVFSPVLVVLTIGCMLANLLLQQDREAGGEAQGAAFAGLTWFAAGLNFAALVVGGVFVAWRPSLSAICWAIELCGSAAGRQRGNVST